MGPDLHQWKREGALSSNVYEPLRSRRDALLTSLDEADNFQQLPVLSRVMRNPGRAIRGELKRSLLGPRWRTVRLFTGQKFTYEVHGRAGPLKYGYWDAPLSSALVSLLAEGMVVIDVGAHYGYYSTLAAHLVGTAGHVHAFEPTPRTARILRANASRVKNMTVHVMALGDKDGEAEITDYGSRYSGLNTVADKPRRDPDLPTLVGRRIKVPMMRLDTYLPAVAPHFVKVDAESSELAVLSGMSSMIKRARPLLLVEVGDYGIAESTTLQLIEWLGVQAYEPREWNGTTLTPHKNQQIYEPGDLFFVPKLQAM